jgi:hypothetical protein
MEESKQYFAFLFATWQKEQEANPDQSARATQESNLVLSLGLFLTSGEHLEEMGRAERPGPGGGQHLGRDHRHHRRPRQEEQEHPEEA